MCGFQNLLGQNKLCLNGIDHMVLTAHFFFFGKNNFPFAGSFPRQQQQPELSRPQPGFRSFVKVSKWVQGSQWLGPSSKAFPGALALDLKWSSEDRNQHPYGMLALQVVAFMLSHNAGFFSLLFFFTRVCDLFMEMKAFSLWWFHYISSASKLVSTRINCIHGISWSKVFKFLAHILKPILIKITLTLSPHHYTTWLFPPSLSQNLSNRSSVLWQYGCRSQKLLVHSPCFYNRTLEGIFFFFWQNFVFQMAL